MEIIRGPHNILRLIRTGATFERTGAMRVVLDALEAPPFLRLALRFLAWPFGWLGYRGDPAMPPVTRALTALGPAYVKFGQILSTRPDVVGPELAAQLQVLQDRLPPFPQEEARAEVARELGAEVDLLFSAFSEPVAAASIAQVHRARRREGGQEVAVKILRPGIERAFRRDIDAFYFAAGMIEFLAPFSRRLRPRDVVAHFDSVVQAELDLRLEAASAAEFAATTRDDPDFHVPSVHWDLSARRVMTLGWAEGINAGDLDAIDAAGFDRAALAERILQSFLRHALRDGFFHGDMHQGNLKIAPDGAILAYDFGIMGRIDAYTRRAYAEILIGFIRRDYRRVAEVHFEAGYVPADHSIEDFAMALRAVGEPIFDMDASRISMGRLLAHLFEVTEQFGMRTRTELILLQRTMVVVEGVARSLDPRMNIWSAARPVVEDYIARTIGPRAALADLQHLARIALRFGPLLPDLIEAALIRARNPDPPKPQGHGVPGAVWAAGGAALALVAVWIGANL